METFLGIGQAGAEADDDRVPTSRPAALPPGMATVTSRPGMLRRGQARVGPANVAVQNGLTPDSGPKGFPLVARKLRNSAGNGVTGRCLVQQRRAAELNVAPLGDILIMPALHPYDVFRDSGLDRRGEAATPGAESPLIPKKRDISMPTWRRPSAIMRDRSFNEGAVTRRSAANPAAPTTEQGRTQ